MATPRGRSAPAMTTAPPTDQGPGDAFGDDGHRGPNSGHGGGDDSSGHGSDDGTSDQGHGDD